MVEVAKNYARSYWERNIVNVTSNSKNLKIVFHFVI